MPSGTNAQQSAGATPHSDADVMSVARPLRPTE